jgi:ribosomal protein S18 acetylase RimI-like enzyme
MHTIQITKATLQDLEQLQLISRATFAETYSHNTAADDIQKYVREAFSTEKLTAEIQNACSEFYLTILDEKIIGYLKLNFGEAQAEMKDKNSLEIERIYVLAEYQGKKVGQLLYQKAIQVANERIVDFVWLGVWEKNIKAIGFYEKNGFMKFGKKTFIVGSDVQTDIIMKLSLRVQ